MVLGGAVVVKLCYEGAVKKLCCLRTMAKLTVTVQW